VIGIGIDVMKFKKADSDTDTDPDSGLPLSFEPAAHIPTCGFQGTRSAKKRVAPGRRDPLTFRVQ
jgi:hypothetical protein